MLLGLGLAIFSCFLTTGRGMTVTLPRVVTGVVSRVRGGFSLQALNVDAQCVKM